MCPVRYEVRCQVSWAGTQVVADMVFWNVSPREIVYKSGSFTVRVPVGLAVDIAVFPPNGRLPDGLFRRPGRSLFAAK